MTDRARGETHGMAKLCVAEVKEIFCLAREGSFSLREIGEMFNVSKPTVQCIKQRRTWSHLDYGDGSEG
jgi:hypothetical protein